jgi:hypothetical protein
VWDPVWKITAVKRFGGLATVVALSLASTSSKPRTSEKTKNPNSQYIIGIIPYQCVFPHHWLMAAIFIWTIINYKITCKLFLVYTYYLCNTFQCIKLFYMLFCIFITSNYVIISVPRETSITSYFCSGDGNFSHFLFLPRKSPHSYTFYSWSLESRQQSE